MLRPSIPVDNTAVQCRTQNCVCRRLHNGSQVRPRGLGPFPFHGIPYGPHQYIAIRMTLEEIILCSLADGLQGDLLVVEATQDDEGHLSRHCLKTADRL
jgi:hypothetical protein